jgi:murein DD-endopeptidase MepM/ murein hydrolase activator NlpD
MKSTKHKSYRRKSSIKIIFGGAVLFMIVLIYLFSSSDKSIDVEKQEVSTLTPVVMDTIVSVPLDPNLRSGEVKPGQGLFQVLFDLGATNKEALVVTNFLREEVELHLMKSGERVRLWVNPQDSLERIFKLEYEPNPSMIHRFVRDLSDSVPKYKYELIQKKTDVSYKLYEGTLKLGSNLDQELREIGIHKSLVQVTNGVLLCKINFRIDARAGDTFRVLIKNEEFEGEWLSGSVLYAQYEGVRAGNHEAFRYYDEDPKSTYNAHYTEKGEALIHSGLRFPVARLHITSTYGMRRHPVTGRRAMHSGVDYRGRTGEAVFAVAEGKVIKSAFDKYSGNKVAIKHSDGTSSWYLHLSKRGVRVGQTVRAGQVIGKIGSTGRVTGPHLHLGFKKKNGRWMNPLKKRMIATPKLKGEKLKLMQGQAKKVRAMLGKFEVTRAPVVAPDSSNLKDSLKEVDTKL